MHKITGTVKDNPCVHLGGLIVQFDNAVSVQAPGLGEIPAIAACITPSSSSEPLASGNRVCGSVVVGLEDFLAVDVHRIPS